MKKLGNKPLIQSKGKVYIIPDIHGAYDQLNNLWIILSKRIKKEDHIVFLGDYLGNYPWSKNLKALILIQKIKNSHKNCFFICGNHDNPFVSFLNNKNKDKYMDKEAVAKELIEMGYPNGEKENVKRFLSDYKIDFFNDLISYYEADNFICSHAPFNHKIFYCHKIEEGILDKLEFSLMVDFVHPDEENIPIKGIDKWLICGHQNNYSKREYPAIYPESKRIFLDCSSRERDKPPIHCLVMPSREIIKSE